MDNAKESSQCVTDTTDNVDTCADLFSSMDGMTNTQNKDATEDLYCSSDSQKTIPCTPSQHSIYCPNSPSVSGEIPTDSVLVNVSFTDDGECFKRYRSFTITN